MDPLLPEFRLGKAPAQPSQHALRFESLLKKKAGPVPTSYDFDEQHPSAAIPTPMFANDRYQNCVIASQAHQTLRFELLQQGGIISITDADVNAEYFRQTGGKAHDKGLVASNALEQWRTRGWQAGGNHYKISAYAPVAFKNRVQVQQAILTDIGMGLGLQLPLSAKTQIVNGQAWDVVAGPTAAKGSWGGHYVYLCGYTPTGPVCVTWGRKQQMTWRWLSAYADEAFAIFDDRNSFNKGLINMFAFSAFTSSFG